MWLFLAAFMIHDFEEIIAVESWMNNNFAKVYKRAPKFVGNRLQTMSNVKSSQFAVAVFLEFIIFVPVTYLAVEHGNYALFIGFNAVLLVHVFTHVGQSLLIRSYTPGVVTALLITLPYSLYLFNRMIAEGLVSLNEIFIFAPFGLLLLPIVLFGHKLGKLAIRN
ncbi:HXXEE domain-containing protein [Paenibacillus sp. NEAU-GSW1]|uniref:HXXEE domain-containing protein n=1 Tax=Paenibacillus sp. NEAU-GSW1 TaxID=2682486 RepID=UPI0020A6A31D|nr:HXXEE domain-containing protein [Paenibacillus sp. NEAU-GSW1]